MSSGYDVLLENTGLYGPYQKWKLSYMYFAAVLLFMPRLTWIIMGAVPDHRCLLPDEDPGANFSLQDSFLNASLPWDTRNQRWSRCSMLDISGSDSTNVQEIPCENMVFEKSTYTSSVVTEWNLVCERSWMRATAQAVADGGIFTGAILLGILSDNVGGALIGVMPGFYTFLVARFIVGFFAAGGSALFVLGVEFLSPEDRAIPGIVFNFFFSLSYFVFLAYAYFINDWRWLQISVCLTGLILLPCWWLLPESNRWLIANGRLEEAKRNVLDAAKTNKVNIDPIYVEQVLKETHVTAKEGNGNNHKEKGVKEFFRHPRLLLIAVKICFIWFVGNATFWGLSYNASNLGGNMYVNVLISGAIEFPSTASLFVFDKYMGRRASLSGLCFASGVILVATAFVPEDMVWLTITCAMIGKMTIAAAYSLIYIYTSELYPTVIRNAGMGISSTSARIGGITAPYILLLADHWKPLPMVIYGCLSLIGGMVSLLLPETKNKPLPETIDVFVSKRSKSSIEPETADKLLPMQSSS